jgi:hypothetical protein
MQGNHLVVHLLDEESKSFFRREIHKKMFATRTAREKGTVFNTKSLSHATMTQQVEDSSGEANGSYSFRLALYENN